MICTGASRIGVVVDLLVPAVERLGDPREIAALSDRAASSTVSISWDWPW